MKIAKANDHDLETAMELCGALDSLIYGYPSLPPSMPGAAAAEDDAFDIEDREQCAAVLGYLLDLHKRANLPRVVHGCAVMLDPDNMCVDPNAETIEHHPMTMLGKAAHTAHPLDEWHEDMGMATW